MSSKATGSSYDFRKRRRTPITTGHPSLGTGRNWQPYLSNGELFAVHEMTPCAWCTSMCNTGSARMVVERDLGFNLCAFYESYPMFRGAGDAMHSGSEVVGLGRTASQHLRGIATSRFSGSGAALRTIIGQVISSICPGPPPNVHTRVAGPFRFANIGLNPTTPQPFYYTAVPEVERLEACPRNLVHGPARERVPVLMGRLAHG